MFMLRLALTFVFVAHSATLLINILPNEVYSILDLKIITIALIELVSAIMLLSGVLISIASYAIIAVIIYNLGFDLGNTLPFIFDINNTFSILIIASALALMLAGPGKIVLSKRYGHTATSLREEGVDKEVAIMGT